MKAIFLRIFTAYLFFLFIASSVVVSLPDNNFKNIYQNKYDSSSPYFVGTLEQNGTSVQVVVDIQYEYNHDKATNDLFISVQYFGNHFSPATVQPRILESDVNINQHKLQFIDHVTSNPSDPHFADHRVYNYRYEYYQYKLIENDNFYAKPVSIKISLQLATETIKDDGQSNGVINADFAHYNLEKTFWVFNKPNLSMLLIPLWLPLLYFIPMLFRHSSRVRSNKSKNNKSQHLKFIGIWLPNLLVMFGALIVSPLTYDKVRSTSNKAYIVPDSTLLTNILLIATLNIVWYLILPILIEMNMKWPKGDIFSQLTIQSSFLKQLHIEYAASEIAFYKNIQQRMIKRVIMGGVFLQAIQMVMVNVLTRTTGIAVFFVPIVYMIWVITRKSILDDYWGRRTLVRITDDMDDNDGKGYPHEDDNQDGPGVTNSQEVIVISH